MNLIRDSLETLHLEARHIFSHALAQSSIPSAFDRHLQFENNTLIRRPSANAPSISVPLDDYKAIYVISLGKAAIAMLDTLLERLPRQVPVKGICCAPSLPGKKHPGFEYYAGGHPSPNPDSFRSARAALNLLHSADQSTFVFFLVSGGGSSLFEAPLDSRISLEDTIAFHRALVGSGAAIAEINTVRKHFSAVKGGRLAAAAGEAAKYSLLISDVPAEQLDALASGPTLPNRSTLKECREVIERYQLLGQFPPSVRAFFASPDLPETPRTILSRMDVLLSNADLVDAARTYAQAQGWTVVIDNTCDDWDYREAARYLVERMHELGREHPRLCLLSGGEVTVRLNRDPGAGGRNQQFALACALELAGKSPGNGARAAVAILSAGSDGVDGLSPAAGAIADSTTAVRAEACGLDPAAALQSFDSYPLFKALGDTVMTGATGNNLRDLRILLSCREG